MPTFENPFDKLQVPIPGMQRFQDAVVTVRNGGYDLSITWIGDYLAGLYQFLIIVVAIFAAVTLIIGAVIWITSVGNPSRIGEAKSWIASSILGLILALSAYLILYTVNPELVILRPINMSSVGSSSGSSNGYSDPGDSDSPITPFGKLTKVDCPTQDYMDRFPVGKKTKAIALYYTKEKMVQTKYVHPKIPAESRLRGLSDNNTSYFDCSAFANYITECLGRNPIPGEGSSYNLFRNPNIKNNRQLLDFVGYKNGEDTPKRLGLQPGDLIGYNDGKGTGHVMTYIGENMLVEAGGTPPAVIHEYGAIKITDFRQRLEGYIDGDKSNGEEKLYYIKRTQK